MAYTIEVNGEKRTVDVDGDTPLLWVLRDELDLKGSKFGCGAGLCGACTVHLDGKAVRSCLTAGLRRRRWRRSPPSKAMAAHPVGKQLQAAWMELDVPQCGYCQAGQIMTAAALLARKPQSERCRHRRGDERQCLPLLHLHAHPRGDQASGGAAARARR